MKLERSIEEYFDVLDDQRWQMINEFRSNPSGRVSIPVVRAARLKRIWLDYGRSGVLRDEKGLLSIESQIIKLIARLKASTEFSGHTSCCPFAEYEIEMDDIEKEKFYNFLTSPEGGFYLSDYGISPLESLAADLIEAESLEAKLHIIDRILNVAHRRSDLASWFVEGGSKTLDEIASQGGYSTESSG